MSRCLDCLYHPCCYSRIAHAMDTDNQGNVLNDIEKRCAEFKNKSDFQEIKHGTWLPYESETGMTEKLDTDGISTVRVMKLTPLSYYCSECKRIEETKQPYCHCGAKMDKEVL